MLVNVRSEQGSARPACLCSTRHPLGQLQGCGQQSSEATRSPAWLPAREYLVAGAPPSQPRVMPPIPPAWPLLGSQTSDTRAQGSCILGERKPGRRYAPFSNLASGVNTASFLPLFTRSISAKPAHTEGEDRFHLLMGSMSRMCEHDCECVFNSPHKTKALVPL